MVDDPEGFIQGFGPPDWVTEVIEEQGGQPVKITGIAISDAPYIRRIVDIDTGDSTTMEGIDLLVIVTDTGNNHLALAMDPELGELFTKSYIHRLTDDEREELLNVSLPEFLAERERETADFLAQMVTGVYDPGVIPPSDEVRDMEQDKE